MTKHFLHLIILFFSVTLQAQNNLFLVDTTVQVIDGTVAPYNNVQPGDTVFLSAGNRNKLLIRNFRGSATNPILFTNKGGAVVISTNEYYGLSVNNCRYIRITGSGSDTIQYGIRITKVLIGSGIGIGNLSSDFEIDHISIENCLTAGIYAKTEADCSLNSTRERFTQYQTIIHDNYINHTGDEGLYIGSSYYQGMTIYCNGHDTTLLPPLLSGVQIYNNIISNTGWDGIQVSSAPTNCRIFNNKITNDSQDETNNQMSGILMGGGSRCDCYNNLIKDGKGDGIENHGLGGNRIFNNIIVNAGRTFKPNDHTAMKHGIFISDVSTIADASYFVLFNDIINPKSDGIRLQSSKSRNNVFASNLIINPGNYQFYESMNTGTLPQQAYLMLALPNPSVKAINNFFTTQFSKAGISDTDYTIQPGSPLINSGSSENQSVDFDFINNSRPRGGLFDIGAYEFTGGTDTLIQPVPAQAILFPNPALNNITIRYYSAGQTKNTLQVYNNTGALILTRNNYASFSGTQEIKLSLAHLPAGRYTCTITNGTAISNSQFIKL